MDDIFFNLRTTALGLGPANGVSGARAESKNEERFFFADGQAHRCQASFFSLMSTFFSLRNCRGCLAGFSRFSRTCMDRSPCVYFFFLWYGPPCTQTHTHERTRTCTHITHQTPAHNPCCALSPQLSDPTQALFFRFGGPPFPTTRHDPLPGGPCRGDVPRLQRASLRAVPAPAALPPP